MTNKEITNFIFFMTHCKSLTWQQIVHRDKLMARDFAYLLDSSANPQEQKELAQQKQHTERSGLHLPREVASFMSFFTSKGKMLKYTTHPWDDDHDYPTFDDFFKAYNGELSSNPFWNDFYKTAPHYYFLVNNFLKAETFEKKGKKEIFWGKEKYKAGYNSDKVLKKWMDANPNCQPYEMPLNQFPESAIPEVEGQNLVNFEDLVNAFKYKIEFRENKLFSAVQRAFKGQDLVIDQSKLKKLRGISFYTDTEFISSVLYRIASNIRNRSEFPNVEIWVSKNKNADRFEEIELHILHVDSFSYADIHSDKLMLKGKGELIDVCNKLRGLCDFSVISMFERDNERKPFAIDYLYSENNDAPRVREHKGPCRGFEYILKFYKA